MKLILMAVTQKLTARNNLPYVELSFYYPAKHKEVKYNAWSFVHNEEHGLQHVWDRVKGAEVGRAYNIHFQKSLVDGQQQFVITSFEEIPNN